MNFNVMDITNPNFKKTSYKMYECLRQYDPVFFFNLPNGERAWIISRYEDVNMFLKDYNLTTKNQTSLLPNSGEIEKRLPQPIRRLKNNILYMDPPDHTRLRMLAAKAFTPAMIATYKGKIQEIANHLLDEAIQKGFFELVNDYAYPLPITVISEMLGVPNKDHQKFREWSDDIISSLGNPETLQHAIPVIQSFFSYIEQLVKIKKQDPTNDLISSLVEAHEGDQKLNTEELYAMILLLIVAGHETTVNLIGNATYALLEYPEQLQYLKDQDEVPVAAIDELLRYYSPIELAGGRWAKQDFTLQSKEIKRGDLIFLSLASANRDEAQFPQAHKLDLKRTPNKHLSFGNGIHYCLGANLARLEGQIAIGTLIRKIPNLQSVLPLDQVEFRPGIVMRSIKKLPIKI